MSRHQIHSNHSAAAQSVFTTLSKLAVLVVIGLAACRSRGEPVIGSILGVDGLVNAQPDPTPPAEVDSTTLQSRFNQGAFEVGTYHRVYSHGEPERPILVPHCDAIYPGSDVQGYSLGQGLPTPITAPRGAGTVAITNATGSSVTSRTVAEVSPASIATTINEIVPAQPQQFLPSLEVSIERVRTHQDMQIDIGANAGQMGIFSAAANFSFENRQNNVAMFVTLRQAFYTIAFERPARLSEFYPGVIYPQLAGQIGPGNPAAYIGEVEYGRVCYLLVQTTSSEELTRAILEAWLLGTPVVVVPYVTGLEGLTIQAYAYGGSGESVRQAILAGPLNWLTMHNSLLGTTYLGDALPIAYTVRSLASNAVIKNHVYADYTYEVLTPLGSTIPTLISPLNQAANLDNGCGVTANSVNWSFNWAIVPGADLYEILISNNIGGTFVEATTTSASYSHQSVGALRATGWTWKVRAKIGSQWQGWSGTRSFTLEQPNTDCTTGVRLYSHPNYAGASLWIPVTPSMLESGFDLEVLGFDDDMDSFRIYNLASVTFYQDPLWMSGGGNSQTYTSSNPNVGSFANRASAGRVNLGLPF